MHEHVFVFSPVNECTKNAPDISVLLNTPRVGIQTNFKTQTCFFSIYSAARIDLLWCCFLCRAGVSPVASLAYLSWPFIFGLNLRPLWRSVCDAHSGNAEQVPLWCWLAVKNFKLPSSCLPPWDITLHPLTLDIPTWQQVSWNCSREKTKWWWCHSLFAHFSHNSLVTSNMIALL